MAETTKIQWCDSTVNPIMGCGGCELYKPAGEIIRNIDAATAKIGITIESKPIFQKIIQQAYDQIADPLDAHKATLNTTNISHLKKIFFEEVKNSHGNEAANAAAREIDKSITCYAAMLHLNRATAITAPLRKISKGYAPIFEQITQYPGRIEKIANKKDLLFNRNVEAEPWKKNLPRMIFVSDMGDAFSRDSDFEFLRKETIPHFQSPAGAKHLWLWLTKRPERMAKFSNRIGGFPQNVCAMTTVTCAIDDNLRRIDHLRTVNARVKGLSIEPLRERLDPKKLDLSGIDWVIVGGESGSTDATCYFDIEWAEEIYDLCKKQKIAFFLKQLGKKPRRNGELIKLKDNHGGDWSEWAEKLRIRDFPSPFYDYRSEELKLHSIANKESCPLQNNLKILSKNDKEEFDRQHRIVKQGIKAFLNAGQALRIIQSRDLWRAGGYDTWEAYCQQVAGISKSYASRLMRGAEIAYELKSGLPIGNASQAIFPLSESQVRPLLTLQETKTRIEAWQRAVEKANGAQPTAKHVAEAAIEFSKLSSGPRVNQAANRAEQRSNQRKKLLQRLRELLEERVSDSEVTDTLNELESLL